MFPWSSVLTGGASIASAAIGAASQSKGQEQTNYANAQIARENRDWQEKMDNSKYQRGVEDARKAGFNPLVAFPGSAGTPMPSTPTMQNPKANRGELALATSQAIANINLTNKQAKTEDTKQELNKVTADNAKYGSLGNKFFHVPINAVKNVASTAYQRLTPQPTKQKYDSPNSYASGTLNRAGQSTGRR